MKYYLKLWLIVFSFILVSCGSSKVSTNQNNNVVFNVNLLDRSDDTFKVTVTPPSLTENNNIYQFASTAPGTYAVMDIGRFVRSFKAFDNKGNEIETKKVSTNQFELTSPESISKIEYHVAETWDTPVSENKLYLMCGTSIEDDHSLINGQGVFGYFKGKQANPIKIKIEYPEQWLVGTALDKNNEGVYLAEDYDHVVDSPILLGDLTKASMDVQGTTIDIFTYSKTGLIKSDQILDSMRNMLLSASGFLNGLPVDRYTFLYHFEDLIQGAWEHSYSSGYVYREAPWENLEKNLLDVAAHEFFHIVTPLNIHSEVVEQFNFVTPVTSDHLWLYEGTTEWAAHMMLFRSRQKSTEDYLKTLRRKIIINNSYFNPNISLVELARTSYTPEGHKQYGNIYMKGALVAGLLDIRLLELSNGERGLIDVINDLAKEYGPNKPFNEKTFFDDFADKTYPEISDFFNKYVKTSEPLPFKEYYEKLGITFVESTYTFSLMENPTAAQLDLRSKWMKQIVTKS